MHSILQIVQRIVCNNQRFRVPDSAALILLRIILMSIKELTAFLVKVLFSKLYVVS